MLRPAPKWMIPACSMFLRVSNSASRPWSMLWLLAKLRWVKPCLASMVSHSGSPLNTKRLKTGCLILVAGHSRLPTTKRDWLKICCSFGPTRLLKPKYSMRLRTPRSSNTSPVNTTDSVSAFCAHTLSAHTKAIHKARTTPRQ